MSETHPPEETESRRRELLAAFAAIGPLRQEQVILPGTVGAITVTRPVDFDRLLDNAAGDAEQNLPYWAEIWPSGVALAALIAGDPSSLAGKPVLEIGCGLGVTAVSALRAGADLLVTDYAPEALALCSLNCLREAGREPRAVRANWRDPESDSFPRREGGFPLVLAADVLYEIRDLEPLLSVTERAVAPGGELWLAEPGRVPATLFVETLAVRGWSDCQETCAGPWPDPEDNRKGVMVTIHRLCRSR